MRRTLCTALFAVLALNVFCLNPVFAQGGNGSVAGIVRDSGGSVLAGALVEAQPTGKKAVSDDQGQYSISDLAPGDYSLNFSYVGLSPFTATVKIASGVVANVEAKLKVASVTEEIVVTAERLQGEAEAINIERTADNIVQVLPSKVINSLPNTNIADAVGRAPSVTLERDEGEGKYVQIRGTEPRLSNVTINGVNVPSPEANVRNIKLDIIPSDLVDRIEVNKTLSANQDADAIGGSVNLVTKTPGEKPTYTFGSRGGYTPIQGGRWLDEFDGTAGKRFGENKKFGILLGGSYDWNGRGIDDLEPTPVPANFNGQNVAYFSGADLRTYKYYRTRYGFAGGMDYKLNHNSTVYARGLYSDFHDYGDTWVYTPNVGNIIKSVNGKQFTFDNAADCATYNAANPPPATQCSPGSMAYRHYIRRPDQQIFSVSMGARHDLKSTLITYEFAVSRAHNIGGQDFATTNFSGPALDLGLNTSNPYRPKFPVLDGTNIYDPTQYTISNIVLPRYHSTQLNFQGAASVARRYRVGSHYGVFELGGKVRDAHKNQLESDQFFDATGNFTLSQVLGKYANPGYYNHSYQFGLTSDYNKIAQLVAGNLQTGFAPNTDKGHIVSDTATWSANERVYAGYLMNTITFGNLSLQTGIRFEGTVSSYTANQVNLSGGAYVSTVPVGGSSSYVNALPSVQAQYLIGKNTNIRATYGMGISRPNFSDLVPSEQVDPNTSPRSIQIGNPGLKPTRANNYDILVEHFFQPLGILQAGFFYKNLNNPIYPTAVNLTSGPFAGYRQQQSINGPNAHITGFETAWEQRLSFLPGFLNGLGVAANYSYTTSQVTFPTGFSGGRIDHPALQRQAPNTWNLGMTYDKSRFSMRFDVSHNDANIFTYLFLHDPTNPQGDKDPILGTRGPTGDQYLYAHTQFDIQGSYRIAKGLEAVVSGLNLSNEVFGFYQGSPIYPNQREYYHPSVIFGMRFSSSGE